jgi:DNA-directed RNA polymerase subunit M/transcription elongation factor TFIIS
MSPADAPTPQIPACPKCGHRKVGHRGEWGHHGDPYYAWFECGRCEHQWRDYQLSRALLEINRDGR